MKNIGIVRNNIQPGFHRLKAKPAMRYTSETIIGYAGLILRITSLVSLKSSPAGDNGGVGGAGGY
jgi:hypothetical protein